MRLPSRPNSVSFRWFYVVRAASRPDNHGLNYHTPYKIVLSETRLIAGPHGTGASADRRLSCRVKLTNETANCSAFHVTWCRYPEQSQYGWSNILDLKPFDAGPRR